MDKLRQAFEENLMNEDEMLKRIMADKAFRKRPLWARPGFLLSLTFASVLVFALALSNLVPPTKTVQTSGVTTPDNKLAYGVVSVDINPSFELYTDINDQVIEIRALNPDARTLVTDRLIGLSVQDAVEDLIAQAQAAGYIDVQSVQPNTVIISTVSYGIDGQRLIQDLQIKLKSSLVIDRKVKTYILDATDDDREKAKEQAMPLGLYLLNGLIQNNGTPMSVSEFVSDPANLERLEDHAERATGEELVKVIQVLIDELAKRGIDTTAYLTRLNQKDPDLEELVEQLKDAFENLSPKGEKESSEEVKGTEQSHESGSSETTVESAHESGTDSSTPESDSSTKTEEPEHD